MNNNAGQAGEWVDAHMAALSPDPDWQPNTIAALAELREQRAARAGSRSARAGWPVAIIVVACLCIVAFRPARSVALRYLRDSVGFLRNISTGRSVGASNLVPQKDRKAAPAFTLRDASDKPVSLHDFQGRVVLLNFWATWCHGCILEVPWFVEFDSGYRSRGLAVVGISIDDGWTKVRPFLAENKVKYTIVLGDEDAGNRYALGAMPMTLVIDRQGKIAAKHVGVVSQSDCKSEIESLLSEK